MIIEFNYDEPRPCNFEVTVFQGKPALSVHVGDDPQAILIAEPNRLSPGQIQDAIWTHILPYMSPSRRPSYDELNNDIGFFLRLKSIHA